MAVIRDGIFFGCWGGLLEITAKRVLSKSEVLRSDSVSRVFSQFWVGCFFITVVGKKRRRLWSSS